MQEEFIQPENTNRYLIPIDVPVALDNEENEILLAKEYGYNPDFNEESPRYFMAKHIRDEMTKIYKRIVVREASLKAAEQAESQINEIL